MNMKNESNNTNLDLNTPADVVDIAAMLDALGAADRESMPRGMGARICEVSFSTVLHPEGADSAAEAGGIAAAAHADRELVPAGLEERVFEASRGELVAATGGLRLVGEGSLPAKRVIRPVWWRTGAARIAAAIAIVVGGAAMFVSMQQGEQTTTEPDAAVIAASFDSELDAFFDLLDSTPSIERSDVGIDTDHSITDTLLEWESL